MIKTVMSCLLAVTKSENIIWGKKPSGQQLHLSVIVVVFWGTVFEMLHFTDTNSKV